jgi:hypothetical protein
MLQNESNLVQANPADDVQIIRRDFPENLSATDHHLFESSRVERIPRPKVRALRNVIATPDGLLFRHGRIMRESFSQAENFESWKLRSKIKFTVKNLLLRRRIRRNAAVWVTDDWSHGYFHWFSDVIPKIIIGSEQIKSFGLLLPESIKTLPFALPSLEAFGVRNYEFITADTTVELETLYIPIHTHVSGVFNEEIAREIRRKCGAELPIANASRRVYISRRDAKRRRIINEDEIAGILDASGFQTVLAERLTFQEQVELFKQCGFLVSLHGAGLTNMFFMPQGARVMEIRLKDARVPNCFFNLASALGIRYFCHWCLPENAEVHPHFADVVVDASSFDLDLQKFLDA